jgi:hypothetical protein
MLCIGKIHSNLRQMVSSNRDEVISDIAADTADPVDTGAQQKRLNPNKPSEMKGSSRK